MKGKQLGSKFYFDREEVTHLYMVKRMNITDLARRYNCCRRTMRKALVDFGLEIRSDPNEGTTLPEDTQELVDLYLKERLSIRKIADMYDASYGGVWDRLRRANVKFRRRGGNNLSDEE